MIREYMDWRMFGIRINNTCNLSVHIYGAAVSSEQQKTQ